MQKLVTTGEISVDRETYDKIETAAHEQGKSVSLATDEAINRALDRAERSDTLGRALLDLSRANQDAYRVAVSHGRDDVARELRVLADQTAALIARSLRGELGRVS